MGDNDLALFAHLMRRAGFGAIPDELEEHAGRAYEAVVEDLLHPERFPDVEEDVLRRYYPELTHQDSLPLWSSRWIYRMVNSVRPLEEKMALFWHQVFATGNAKVDNSHQMLGQLVMFRRHGMGNYRDILMQLSQNPAMLYFLDNS